jgi:hypothetical protein
MAYLVVGQPAPHLKRFMDAAALAARVKPVGSLNVQALSQQRHIAGRRALEADARGMGLIGDLYASSDAATTLQHGISAPVSAEGRSAHIVEYTGATDSIRLIKLTSIEPSVVRLGNVERYMVETSEGDMLLRGTTVVVWE